MIHTVIETAFYISDAEHAGLSEDEVEAIKDEIARHPHRGDLMAGTGGARKRRFAVKGKGKRGGARVVSYYAAEDVPIFLLAVYGKGDRDNLSKAERNELRQVLAGIASDYREGQRKQLNSMKGKGQRHEPARQKADSLR